MSTWLKLTAAILVSITFSVFNMVQANPYQPNSQQWHNYNAQMQDAARQNSGYSANRHREKIKADMEQMRIERQIKRYRKTPYYYAIVYDKKRNSVSTAGGYASEQKAIDIASADCRKTDSCHLITTFANTCGVITFPYKLTSPSDVFVGIDNDDYKAAEKSMRMCEAAKGKGNCGYSANPTKHGTAFCTGYDYGIYSNK